MTNTKKIMIQCLQITNSIPYHPIYSIITGDFISGILLSYLTLEWWSRDTKTNPTFIILTNTKLTNILMINQDQLHYGKEQILKIGVFQVLSTTEPDHFAYILDEQQLEKILVQCIDTADLSSQNSNFPQNFPIRSINIRSNISSSLQSREVEDDIIDKSSKVKNTDINTPKVRTIEKEKPTSSSPLPLREEKDDEKAYTNTESTKKLTKSEMVQFVFDFWNEFKGLNKPGTTIRWQSHNKLTPLIETAILQVLREAAELEEDAHIEVCYAIENYAHVLLSENTYYSHVWPLQTFFTVHETNKSTSMKKWQKFLNTNFVYDFYLTERPVAIPKHDEALCKAIIRRYGKTINNPQFMAQGSEHLQFAACAILAKTAYTKYHLPSTECLDYFFQMLEEEFIDKGQAILPGHLASHRLWEARFAQFLSSQGL